ncbi:MAG: SDR family NAD(P)-dependent oxidoreductase [Lachnospiraceae bacterium]
MKIAVITGASSGLGREFARQIPKLYKSLDEIWVFARRTERLKELEKELLVPVRIFDSDLKRDYVYEKLEKILERENPDIRMLVNAAGCGKTGRLEKLSLEGQIDMIDVNIRALTRMTCLCLPYLHKGSRVIQIASAAAFAPQPGFAVYAASKSYVYSLSLALSCELEERGISVTAVCPGPVDTEFFVRAGGVSGSMKASLLKDAGAVVRQALLDSVKRKRVSVCGYEMKAARAAAKLLPLSMISRLMKKINEKGDY